MKRQKAIAEMLERCSCIAFRAEEDFLRFGPGSINDPDTGVAIRIDGYSLETNKEVLTYMEKVAGPLSRYYSCLKDLLFFEDIFSIENIPDFLKPGQIAQYFKINYQSWLIKAETIFDCTSQALNAVFELGFQPRAISKKHIVESRIRDQGHIFQHIENLEKVLVDTANDSNKLKRQLPIRYERNKIIHQNEFDNPALTDLEVAVTFSIHVLLDIEDFQVQAKIGSTGEGMKKEIEGINNRIVTEVFPIFGYIDREYEKRFETKLIR